MPGSFLSFDTRLPWTDSRSMADLPTNGAITANGDYDYRTEAGRLYAFILAGTFDSGTAVLRAVVPGAGQAETEVALNDIHDAAISLTVDGIAYFRAASRITRIVLSGIASAADLTASFTEEAE